MRAIIAWENKATVKNIKDKKIPRHLTRLKRIKCMKFNLPEKLVPSPFNAEDDII